VDGGDSGADAAIDSLTGADSGADATVDSLTGADGAAASLTGADATLGVRLDAPVALAGAGSACELPTSEPTGEPSASAMNGIA
jgi:hypothetical protein